MDEHKELMAENYHMEELPEDSRLLTSTVAQEEDYFISAEWLKETLDKDPSDIVLLDVTRGPGDYRLDVTRVDEDYEKGHIPTAVHFSTDEFGEFKDYLKKPEELKKVFLSKGVTKDTRLVLYSVYARDIMYIASRVAFTVYYLGVEDIKILDGGLQAWEREGYPLETGTNTPQAAGEFGAEVPGRPEIYLQDPRDLKDYLEEHPDSLLVSVRSWNEYLGRNAGHSWNKGQGEIAGALYMGDDLLTNQAGYMSDPEEYLDAWEEWGITPDKEIILYCGTSWRASTAFFLLKQLGWPQVKIYDGSWYKWYLAHEENPAQFPIQRGNPQEKDDLEIIKE